MTRSDPSKETNVEFFAPTTANAAAKQVAEKLGRYVFKKLSKKLEEKLDPTNPFERQGGLNDRLKETLKQVTQEETINRQDAPPATEPPAVEMPPMWMRDP